MNSYYLTLVLKPDLEEKERKTLLDSIGKKAVGSEGKVEKEDFTVDMPLALGENVISLTLYPKNSQGRSQQKELRIYYLDEQ